MDLRLRRRILLFLTLVCSAAGAFADNTYHQKETDDYVTLGDLTVEPGSGEEYELTVNLNGTQIYTAFEMDIELPSGLEPVMEEDDDGKMSPKVWLWMGENTIFPYTVRSGNKIFSHDLAVSYGAVGKNILRMACLSVKGKDFTATSGTLVTIYCKASPYLKPGVDDVHITKCHLTTNEKVIIDGKEMRGQQYNCKDRTETINALAKSTATINVSAKNQWGSCVVPFDIPKLPSGLEAYTVTDRQSGIAYLKQQTSILAYTPVLLYAENGFSGTFSGDVDETKYKEVRSRILSTELSFRRQRTTASCCRILARVSSYMPCRDSHLKFRQASVGWSRRFPIARSIWKWLLTTELRASAAQSVPTVQRSTSLFITLLTAKWWRIHCRERYI